MDQHVITETTMTAKALAIGTAPASALYVTSQSCAIDYGSPHVFIPLTASILAAIYTIILIQDKLRNRNK